jgi:hypothetical protein
MKKTFLAIAICVSSAAAFPQAANFFSATASISDSGALTVTFDERGLGNNDVSYQLTGTGSAVYACINKGGNHPQATNKADQSPIDVTKENVKPKNGRIQDSITAPAPSPGTFTCPSGQAPALVCVNYTDLLLHDLTHGTSIPPTGTTSRTLLSVKGVRCP